jgi:hypothetical protein
MLWTETRTHEEAEARRFQIRRIDQRLISAAGLQDRNRGTETGADESWTEALQMIRGNPAARLSIAVRHLPKPAAFREACRALRMSINEKYEANRNFENEAFALHRLAAIASVAAHELLEITPFSMIEQLDLAPATLGWESFSLLGQKDFTLMAGLWGHPSRHLTGEMLYPEIALAASASLAAIRIHEQKAQVAHIARHDGVPGAETARAGDRHMVARVAGWLRRGPSQRSTLR